MHHRHICSIFDCKGVKIQETMLVCKSLREANASKQTFRSE